MANNNVTEVLNVPNFAPKEQDRFSLIFQAHYQQWDADTVTCNVKTSRLVDEPQVPIKLPILKLRQNESKELRYDKFYTDRDFDLVIVNKTGLLQNSRQVVEEAKESYLEISTTGGLVLDIIKPGRMRLTNVSLKPSEASTGIVLTAINFEAQVLVLAFPE